MLKVYFIKKAVEGLNSSKFNERLEANSMSNVGPNDKRLAEYLKRTGLTLSPGASNIPGTGGSQSNTVQKPVIAKPIESTTTAQVPSVKGQATGSVVNSAVPRRPSTSSPQPRVSNVREVKMPSSRDLNSLKGTEKVIAGVAGAGALAYGLKRLLPKKEDQRV